MGTVSCNVITVVTVGFVETSFSVEEGEKPVTVCVKLGQAIERQITTTLNTDSTTAQGTYGN